MKENNITMSDLTNKSWKHNETNEIITYDPSIDYFERYDLLPKDMKTTFESLNGRFKSINY